MKWARPRQRVYGMLPQHEALGSLGAEEACSFAFTRPKEPPLAGPMSEQDRKAVQVLRTLFDDHIDMKKLLADLEEASAKPGAWVTELPQFPGE